MSLGPAVFWTPLGTEKLEIEEHAASTPQNEKFWTFLDNLLKYKEFFHDSDPRTHEFDPD